MIVIPVNGLVSWLVAHKHGSYLPWTVSSEVKSWLSEHCSSDYLIRDRIKTTFEQGVGEIAIFTGVEFIFDDQDDAMLFKLTWCGV